MLLRQLLGVVNRPGDEALIIEVLMFSLLAEEEEGGKNTCPSRADLGVD